MTKRTIVEGRMAAATAEPKDVYSANALKAARNIKDRGQTGYFAIDLRDGREVSGPAEDEAALETQLKTNPDSGYFCIIQVV